MAAYRQLQLRTLLRRWHSGAATWMQQRAYVHDQAIECVRMAMASWSRIAEGRRVSQLALVVAEERAIIGDSMRAMQTWKGDSPTAHPAWYQTPSPTPAHPLLPNPMWQATSQSTTSCSAAVSIASPSSFTSSSEDGEAQRTWAIAFAPLPFVVLQCPNMHRREVNRRPHSRPRSRHRSHLLCRHPVPRHARHLLPPLRSLRSLPSLRAPQPAATPRQHRDDRIPPPVLLAPPHATRLGLRSAISSYVRRDTTSPDGFTSAAIAITRRA